MGATRRRDRQLAIEQDPVRQSAIQRALIHSIPRGAPDFMSVMLSEILTARRKGRALSMMLMRLCKANTSPGDQDRISARRRTIMRTVEKVLRENDRVGHLGEGEVLMLLIGSDADGANVAQRRLISILETRRLPGLGVTASLASTALRAEDDDLAAIIERMRVELSICTEADEQPPHTHPKQL